MTLENIVASVSGVLTDYVMVITLLLMALYFQSPRVRAVPYDR